jgi:hypothetical protein
MNLGSCPVVQDEYGMSAVVSTSPVRPTTDVPVFPLALRGRKQPCWHAQVVLADGAQVFLDESD